MTKHIFARCLIAAGLSIPSIAHSQDQVLRVCFGDNDAPRADKAAGTGFDVDVMRAVAARVGRTLESVWIEQEPKMTEVEKSDLPLPDLIKGRCDAVASIPGVDALGGTGGQVELSKPYYGVGFEFVSSPDGPADLSQMKGKTIAIQFVTVGHMAMQALGLKWMGSDTPDGQIAALDAGEADAALVWGPALGPLKRAPLAGTSPMQALRWNQHVATRKSDTALTTAIDTALTGMMASGEITKLMQAHGIPIHEPFDSVFNQLSLINLKTSM